MAEQKEARRKILSHLRMSVFCVLNKKDHLGKFEPKTDEAIFLGY